MKKTVITVVATVLFLGALFLIALVPHSYYATASISLKVKNAPAKYYVTVLEKQRGFAKENSPSRVEKFDDDVVVSFFENYSYEGWAPKHVELDVGVRKRDVEGGDDYGLSWVFDRGPIRVALVDEQGEVHVSKEFLGKENVIEATYDAATGEITEQRWYWIKGRLDNLLTCFVLTVLSTVIVLVVFRYPFTGRNLMFFWIANMVAFLPLSYCVRHLFIDRGLEWYHPSWWLIGEAVVAVAGAVAAAYLLRTEKDERAPFRSAACFVVCVIAGIFAATMMPGLIF